MDVVSAASSVAGILSIVGQSIEGIIKLMNFFADVKSASRTIEFFLRDIKSLLLALNDVEGLLSQISTSVLSGDCTTNVTSLQIELEDCHKDVCLWLKVASNLRPSSSVGAKAWFKKFWIGVKQGSVKDIRSEIGRHRQAIQLNLAVIERSMSLQASCRMLKTSEQIERLQLMPMSLDATFALQRTTLERIQSFSQTSMQSSVHSLKSLESIANSISRLEKTSPTAFNHSPSCSSLFNGSLARSVSQRSLDRVGREPPDSLSQETRSQLESECNKEPDKQLIMDKDKLDGNSYDWFPSQPNQSSCSCIHLVHCQCSSTHLSEQPWSSSTLASIEEICARPSKLIHNHSYRKNVLRSVPELHAPETYDDDVSEVVDLKDDDCVPLDAELKSTGKLNERLRAGQASQKYESNFRSSSGVWIKSGQIASKINNRTLDPPLQPKLDIGRAYSMLQYMAEKIYPASVRDYILCGRVVNMIQGQLNLLHSTKGTYHIRGKDENASETKMTIMTEVLKGRLDALQELLQELRKQCIENGYPLYEIDQALRLSAQPTTIAAENGSENHGVKCKHKDMFEIRKETLNSNLLRTFASTRDRINNWLLHSLRSDDKLASLHRSMLAEQDISEKEWTRQTLKHWTLDEAATGVPLLSSLSVAATDSNNSRSTESLDFWTCYESTVGDDGVLMNTKLASAMDELRALKVQHHRRLYRDTALLLKEETMDPGWLEISCSRAKEVVHETG